MRLVLIVTALIASLGVAPAAFGTQPTPLKRVALVIGNANYANAPLLNPVNDARDFSRKIKGFGYEVVYLENIKVNQIGKALREFKSTIAPGSNVVIFYAGHGLQIRGENYFPGVDAEIEGEEDVPNQSMSLRQVLDIVEEAKSGSNIVFLDACRNNPFERKTRSLSRGLARVDSPSGTLISYATRPGSVADDGPGRNGLYTSQLLKEMDGQKPIEQILKQVVTKVKTASKGKQEPWFEGSLEGNFCFGQCLDFEAEKVRLTEEVGNWEAALTKNTIAEYQSYLDKYPQGTFASAARRSIERLKSEPSPSDIAAINEKLRKERETMLLEAETIKKQEMEKIELMKQLELEKIERERLEREKQLAIAQKKLQEEERNRAELEAEVTRMKNTPPAEEAKPTTRRKVFISPSF